MTVEVLSSRVLLSPTDLAESQRFYGEILGLAVAREFGTGPHHGKVFYAGNGLLEVSGRSKEGPRTAIALWLQVRNVVAEIARLTDLGVSVTKSPRLEPWGLIEAWITDPDGNRIVLVEIPDDHPLRRDHRTMNLPLPPMP